MSFLKKLGLVEDDEKEKPVSKTTKTTAVTPVQVSPVYMVNAVGQEDPAYSKIIDDAFEKADLPGPDFREFFKTLKTFDNQPLTEQQKYVAAFAGLQVMGLTKDKMLDTSVVYLRAIDTEKANFEKTLEQYNQNEIVAKSQQASKLTEENARLQKQIQENLAKISTLNTEVAQNTQNHMSKGQAFAVAVETRKNLINTIVENIKKYL